MNQEQQRERDALNKSIAEIAGWTDVHGGAEDGGAYLRGVPPGGKEKSGCLPVPDLLALVNGHCPPAKTCEWKEDSNGLFDTGCNETFEFMIGVPNEAGFNYCPYCGGEIEVVLPPLTAEEIEMEKGDRAYQEQKDKEAEEERPWEIEIEEGPWSK